MSNEQYPRARIFQPPSLPDPANPDLNTRFKTLADYWTRKFFPYLFDYLTSVTVLDQVRCNAVLTGTQDGANADFRLAAGPIRLAPDGTPQAIMASSPGVPTGLTPLLYVEPAALVAGTWTLIVTPGSTQQIVRFGTPPAVTDVVRALWAALV